MTIAAARWLEHPGHPSQKVHGNWAHRLAEIVDDISISGIDDDVYVGIRRDGTIDIGTGLDADDPVTRISYREAEALSDKAYAMWRKRDHSVDGLIDHDTYDPDDGGSFYLGISNKPRDDDEDTEPETIFTLGVSTGGNPIDGWEYRQVEMDEEGFDEFMGGLQRLADDYEPEEVDAVGVGNYDARLMSDHRIQLFDGEDNDPPSVDVGLAEDLADAIERLQPGDDPYEIDDNVIAQRLDDGSLTIAMVTDRGFETDVEFDAEDVDALVEGLRDMIKAEQDSMVVTESVAWRRWLEHGTHLQKSHGNRYNIPGDRGSGLRKTIRELRDALTADGVKIPRGARRADLERLAKPGRKPSRDDQKISNAIARQQRIDKARATSKALSRAEYVVDNAPDEDRADILREQSGEFPPAVRDAILGADSAEHTRGIIAATAAEHNLEPIPAGARLPLNRAEMEVIGDQGDADGAPVEVVQTGHAFRDPVTGERVMLERAQVRSLGGPGSVSQGTRDAERLADTTGRPSPGYTTFTATPEEKRDRLNAVTHELSLRRDRLLKPGTRSPARRRDSGGRQHSTADVLRQAADDIDEGGPDDEARFGAVGSSSAHLRDTADRLDAGQVDEVYASKVVDELHARHTSVPGENAGRVMADTKAALAPKSVASRKRIAGADADPFAKHASPAAAARDAQLDAAFGPAPSTVAVRGGGAVDLRTGELVGAPDRERAAGAIAAKMNARRPEVTAKVNAPDEPTIGVKVTSRGRTTTVTLPDGTTQERTSKTREYSHAVVATIDRHAQGRRVQANIDRRREFVDALNQWKADGADRSKLKAYPSHSMSLADKERGVSKTEYYLPGFEPVRQTARSRHGSHTYWDDPNGFSLPDFNDKTAANFDGTGAARWEKYGPDYVIGQQNHHMLAEQRRADDLMSRPQFEYSVHRWSQSADNAHKAIGSPELSDPDTRYQVVGVGGVAKDNRQANATPKPTRQELDAQRLERKEQAKQQRADSDAKWAERRISDIRDAPDDDRARSLVVGTTPAGLRYLAREVGVKTPRGLSEREREDHLRREVVNTIRAQRAASEVAAKVNAAADVAERVNAPRRSPEPLRAVNELAEVAPGKSQDQGLMHFDSAVGRVWSGLGEDAHMEVRGRALGNIIADIGEGMGLGHHTSSQARDQLVDLRRDVPDGTHAAQLIDQAIERMKPPAKTAAPSLPDGTHNVIRKYMDDLNDIPLVRRGGDSMGMREENETARLKRAVDDLTAGRIDPFKFASEVRGTGMGMRHESQEGFLDIVRAFGPVRDWLTSPEGRRWMRETYMRAKPGA